MMVMVELPNIVRDLISARNQLRHHYKASGLKFTLDGNLVGDIGEAVASEIFDLILEPGNSSAIDGRTRDGRTVQIKATGTNRGPAFRNTVKRAEHLIFLSFDFENLTGEVIFNGPEEIVLEILPKEWIGQRSLTRQQIVNADSRVQNGQRLPMKPMTDIISAKTPKPKKYNNEK
jgi:uncharacterized protein DUF6998